MFSEIWKAFLEMIQQKRADPVILPIPHNNAPNPSQFSDQEIVAKTLWGEARDQGSEGMQAIANVIMRRAALGGWWGNNPRAVCLYPSQFSCWNPDTMAHPNPNLSKMLAVTASDPQYLEAMQIAGQAIAGQIENIVCDADSYKVHGTYAEWAQGLTPITSVGAHDFYITRKRA